MQTKIRASLVPFLFALLAATADGQLQGIVNHDGLISVSVDANGNNNPAGGLLDVAKPNAGATVRAAYLAAASHTLYFISNTDIELAGTPIVWTDSVFTGFFHNVFADVTAIAAPIIDAAPAGIVQIPVTENNTLFINGTILAVVFDDPEVTESSGAIFFFGAQATTGDQFTISLASPLDLSDPGVQAIMGLGIGHGFQGTAGTPMVSEIDVNGIRLTSSAGGEDDGGSFDGGLITVGGLGDDPANPADPFAPSTGYDTDDELYDLLPFVQDGDTQIVVDTLNPTNDDDVFFGYFLTSVPASVDDETIFLGPIVADLALGTDHTVVATVTVAGTQTPIAGRSVNFAVVSGPHAGLTGSDVTDASGEATFTYTGGLAVGTDSIVADMIDSNSVAVSSNTAMATWLTLLAEAYCLGSGCPCGNDSFAGGGCTNSTGQGGLLSASGSGGVMADDLVLTVQGLPADRPSMIFMGPGASNLPFGDGLLCVGPGVPSGLYHFAPNSSGTTGSFQLGPGIVSSSQGFGMGGAIELGQTWNFQAVYREDPAVQCQTGWNTSNALAITFGG